MILSALNRNYTTKQWSRWWAKRKKDWKVEHLSTWQHPHRYFISSLLKTFDWYSLMEIGCGAGANLVHITKTIGGRQLGGIDINPEMIKLAEETFKGGQFKVGSGDDLLMSDDSTDVTLTDMFLIYISPTQIKKYVLELRRITRKRVVLCEFHSYSWWERFKLRLQGLHAYNYRKLLERQGFYDIHIYKLPDVWGDETHKKFSHIIIAKVPRRKNV